MDRWPGPPGPRSPSASTRARATTSWWRSTPRASLRLTARAGPGPVRPPPRGGGRRRHRGRARAHRGRPLDGAAQRRRQRGRDERERHALPGPGRGRGRAGPAPRLHRGHRGRGPRRLLPAGRAARATAGPGWRWGRCASARSGPTPWPATGPGRSTWATPTWWWWGPRTRPRSRWPRSGPGSRPTTTGGINVEFVSWAGGDRLVLRVWERGVGETLACGTGSCAAAAVARGWGLVGDHVLVDNPGGTLEVWLGPTADDPVQLAGPVRRVARGRGGAGLARRRGQMSAPLPGTLIDRSFRERIVLVGVVFPGTDPEAVEANLDELALLVDTAGADVAARVVQRRDRPDPATFVGRGKAAELAAALGGGRRRHRGLRRRAVAGPAAEPGEAAGAHGHRPHGGDPRHLRPERPQHRGQGPGRAGPPALPPAPPARAGGSPSASRPAASAPGAPARPSSRWTGGAWSGACTASRPTCAEVERTRHVQRRSRARGPPPRAGPGGLHQRRQVDPAQPPDRRRGPGREPPLRHLGPANPPARPPRRGDRAGDRHRGVRPQAPPRAGRGVRLHPRVGPPVGPGGPRGRRLGGGPRGPDGRRARRCWTRSGRGTSPSWWW